jgi:hypothetical protein
MPYQPRAKIQEKVKTWLERGKLVKKAETMHECHKKIQISNSGNEKKTDCC